MRARLHATLIPERLGHSTTVGFSFEIESSHHGVPPPLTQIDVSYPGDLGIALSGLGLETCTPAKLEAIGPKECPANSVMGYGNALAELQIGPEVIAETASVTIVRGPGENGHLTLLFYSDGKEPVSAQIVFPAVLLPAPSPFGGRINVHIPLIESFPQGPDLAIVRLRATLGPEHLTYYEHVHGRIVPYNPKGILLPNKCPLNGFPFAANFTFIDGTRASAQTSVPCPRHTRSR
jgi:hypothetical protein